MGLKPKYPPNSADLDSINEHLSKEDGEQSWSKNVTFRNSIFKVYGFPERPTELSYPFISR